jgi:hypothetical protein
MAMGDSGRPAKFVCPLFLKTLSTLRGDGRAADHLSRAHPFAICYLLFVISFEPSARMKVGIVRVFYTLVRL